MASPQTMKIDPSKATAKPKAPPTKRKASSRTKAPKKAKSVFDDPAELLESENSPIYQDETNMKAILQHPLAIETLVDSPMGYLFESVTSQELSTSCAQVKQDGISGRFDPIWLKEGLIAFSRRGRGDFDAYLEQKFKEQWADDEDEDDVDELAH